jgi:hypothetical protein
MLIEVRSEHDSAETGIVQNVRILAATGIVQNVRVLAAAGNLQMVLPHVKPPSNTATCASCMRH